MSGNEVVFDPSLHGGSIGLNSQLTISQSITIAGPGASKLTIDGLGHGRVFHVQPGAGTAIISGLTLTGGQGVQYGGGIFDQATLKLDGVGVVGNSALWCLAAAFTPTAPIWK